MRATSRNPLSTTAPTPGSAKESDASEAASVCRVEINGDAHELPLGSKLIDLLGSLNLAGKRVAVAVNRSVIVRARYADVKVADGDRIEILEAVGGG